MGIESELVNQSYATLAEEIFWEKNAQGYVNEHLADDVSYLKTVRSARALACDSSYANIDFKGKHSLCATDFGARYEAMVRNLGQMTFDVETMAEAEQVADEVQRIVAELDDLVDVTGPRPSVLSHLDDGRFEFCSSIDRYISKYEDYGVTTLLGVRDGAAVYVHAEYENRSSNPIHAACFTERHYFTNSRYKSLIRP